jgi:hypothetical protein
VEYWLLLRESNEGGGYDLTIVGDQFVKREWWWIGCDGGGGGNLYNPT